MELNYVTQQSLSDEATNIIYDDNFDNQILPQPTDQFHDDDDDNGDDDDYQEEEEEDDHDNF